MDNEENGDVEGHSIRRPTNGNTVVVIGRQTVGIIAVIASVWVAFTFCYSIPAPFFCKSTRSEVKPILIMGSPSSSARLTLLPSNYLSSQNPSSEITLQSLIDVSDRMANEAKEALPYNFDECSYSKGYLRQSVWSCLGASRSKKGTYAADIAADCGEKGVCYGCSISCHSG